MRAMLRLADQMLMDADATAVAATVCCFVRINSKMKVHYLNNAEHNCTNSCFLHIMSS